MYLKNSLKWMVMLALLAALFLNACATTYSETATAQEQAVINEPTQTGQESQIEELVWAFEEAYEKGDLDAVMAFYADDVVSLPPGFPKSEGKVALEAAFQEFFDTFTIERDFELSNVDVSGQMATRLGEWTQTLTPKDGGTPIVEVGRCILGFEKQGNEWKIVWEIWNTVSVTGGEPVVEEHSPEELEAQFIEVVMAFEEAYKANDVDRIMEFYADDVATFLPGLPPLEGKEAVRTDWEYFFDTFTLKRESELVYVNVDGGSAIRRMKWTNTLTPKDGGDTIVDTGNCIVGYKKVGDEWKIAWEMAATYDPTQQ